MFGPGMFDGLVEALLTAIVLAFIVGVIVGASLMWLWPYLPSVQLIWN